MSGYNPLIDRPKFFKSKDIKQHNNPFKKMAMLKHITIFYKNIQFKM